jgi:hypothetical protein
VVVLAGVALVAGCDQGDEPQLTILDPSAGENVELEDDMKVDVDLFVRNFDVKEPGKCDDANDPCGQIVLKIDGDTCNAAGTGYNAIRTDGSSDIDADFALCPEAQRFGTHLITVMLVPDSTVVRMATGPVQASVSVVTTPP